MLLFPNVGKAEHPSCAPAYNPLSGYYDPKIFPEGAALGYSPVTRVSYKGKNYQLIAKIADPGKSPEISPGSQIWKIEGLCTANPKTQSREIDTKDIINDIAHLSKKTKNSENLKQKSEAEKSEAALNENTASNLQSNNTPQINPNTTETMSRIIGYLKLFDTITIENASSQGYQGLIIDILSIENEKTTFQNPYFSAYQISSLSENQNQEESLHQKIKEKIIQDIESARQKFGLKFVLATIDESSFQNEKIDIERMVKNLVEFLKSHNLNGIHLSFEQAPQAFNSNKLMSFLQKLRSVWPEVIISAQVSPIIVNDQVQYASYENHNLYQEAMISGLFDFICLKTYGDSGLFLTSDGHFCSSENNAQCIDETMPEFMISAFQALKRLIPAKTQIVINQAASEKRAQIASPFQGSKSTTLFQEWATLGLQLSSDSQFGGVSADVSSDAENGFQWVHSLNTSLKTPNPEKSA